MKRIAPYLAGALIALLLVFVLRPLPKSDPIVALGTLTLTEKQINALEPKAEAPKGIHKITTSVAKPILKAEAKGAAKETVTSFANAVAATLAKDTASSVTPDSAAGRSGDSAAAPASSRPQCFIEAYESTGKKLSNFLVCSDLAKRLLVYNAPGKHKARVDGDSVVVTYPRFDSVVKNLKVFGLVLIGLLVGYWVS